MTIFKDILNDIKVELMDEFDRNFERKSFFGKPWKNGKFPNKKGSMMMRSGKLRKGNRATTNGNDITFSNSQPYASIHNEGAKIKVTPKMKKFFWAMYYKTSGSSAKSKGQKKVLLTEEAQWWRNLALKKVGDTIVIEQRQFIGWHPEVKKRIEYVFQQHFNDIEKYITNTLKRK